MIKKPKNDMHTVTVEGYHRDKPVVARFERASSGYWNLTLTIDGVAKPLIRLKGDKPCWATAKHEIDVRGLAEKLVPASRTERRVAASKRADARRAAKDH
jgi:hypothetical protein